MFNFFIPWPVHFTSHIASYKKITFGENSIPGTSPGTYINAENGLIIGKNVRMGPYVQISTVNHDLSDYSKFIKEDPIKIGNNVWIGGHVVLLPGVTIGDNVVIGAGSVVTKSIPSNSVVVGNPAKVIKEKKPYKSEHQ